MTTWKTSDGTMINYEVHGDPTHELPLLLLPGLLGAIETQWRPFLPALTPYYQVIMVDLRGHGRSENRSHDLRPEQMVSDLGELLDHLGLNRVHVAGYNLGGLLGLMLYQADPRRVATLLMHATKFYWTKDALTKMRLQLDPDQMVAKVPGYADQLANEHGAGRWRNLVRQAADLVAYCSDKGPTEGSLGRVQCPVLVSVGDRDELVLLPEALRLSRLLPKGGLLVLPGVRHPFSAIRPVPLIPMMLTFHHKEEGRR